MYGFDGWLHQLTMTYVFICSRAYLFDMDMRKSFQNKLNLKLYSDSICSKKTG
jgi:hypothetical protein